MARLFSFVLFATTVAVLSALDCGPNENKVQCKPCESLCKNGQSACTMQCIPGEYCGCKPGYLRDDATKKCVRQEECRPLTQ